VIPKATREHDGSYLADVFGCARCGANHLNLRFMPFKRPQRDLTHWSACPATREPILFKVADASSPRA
jgi:hypothetical protein